MECQSFPEANIGLKATLSDYHVKVEYANPQISNIKGCQSDRITSDVSDVSHSVQVGWKLILYNSQYSLYLYSADGAND